LSRYLWKKQIHKLLCSGKKASIEEVLCLDKEVTLFFGVRSSQLFSNG
jgi:hypothetical protein